MSDPSTLTVWEKMRAMGFKYYSWTQWTPKVGDYYTTSRPDLEVYKIVDIKDGKVYTSYLPLGGVVAEWDEKGFTTEGFGPCRVWVPPFAFDNYKPQ